MNKLLFSALTFVFLALVFGGWYAGNRQVNQAASAVDATSSPSVRSTTNTPSIPTTTLTRLDATPRPNLSPEAKAAIEKAAKDASMTTTLYTDNYQEWKVAANSYLPLMGYSFHVETGCPGSDIECVTNSKYKNYDTSEVTEALVAEITATFDASFTNQGFIKNPTNSTRDELIKYKGYTKGDIYCLVGGFAFSSNAVSVFCGTSDANEIANRAELKSLYQSNDELMMWVQEREENSARVTLNLREGSGYYALAVKQNGIWKEVFSGQDVPVCSLVDIYKLSKAIYQNCYDETTATYRFVD